MNPVLMLWLGLLSLFIIVEVASVGLICVWFALGALAAALLCLLKFSLAVQIVAFVAVSAAALAALRPLFRKFVQPEIVPTNVDSIPGSVVPVTEAIDNIRSQGQVRLNAMPWTARSTSGEPIAVGTLVKVDRVEGVKLYVTPAKVESKV